VSRRGKIADGAWLEKVQTRRAMSGSARLHADPAPGPADRRAGARGARQRPDRGQRRGWLHGSGKMWMVAGDFRHASPIWVALEKINDPSADFCV
jgi:hypothetical protein